MSQGSRQSWVPWALLGAGILAVIILIAALTQGDDEVPTVPQSVPEGQPSATEICFDKADHPSYDGADLSGYARFLTKDDPNNCRQSFIDRVRRFASDTCKHQPVVYPKDTEEFIGYLRSACAAAGHSIH